MDGNGDALFAAVEAMELEGIVSKRLSSPYRSGSSPDWLKIKCFTEEDLIVIGIEQGDKGPVALCVREQDRSLRYAGGAMVTLRKPERDQFWRMVELIKVSRPSVPLKARKDVMWLRPAIVVRVRTLRGEQLLRHATVKQVVGLAEGFTPSASPQPH